MQKKARRQNKEQKTRWDKYEGNIKYISIYISNAGKFTGLNTPSRRQILSD